MNSHHKFLNLLAWNAGGLSRNKALELHSSLTDLQIDMALLSETHLTKCEKRFFEGYKMYNAKHPSNNSRGGASVLIRASIKHSLIKIIENEEFQSVVIEIDTSLGSFNVAAVYSPPKHKITKEKYLSFFKELGPKFLIGGDWNAKNSRWGSRLTTVKGKNMEEAVSMLQGNYISPGKPTFFPYNQQSQPDLLDFFVFKNVPLVDKTACDILDVKIDHAPVTLTIFETPILTVKSPSLTSHRTNWEEFREKLTSQIQPLDSINTREDLDRETELFVAQIQEAAIFCTPVAAKGVKMFRLPGEILNLIKTKRKLKRRWAYTRHPEDKTEVNIISNVVKKKLNDFRNKKFEEFITKLGVTKDDNYSLWKATKFLKRPVQLSLPIKKPDGSWANNSRDKADTLAEYFASVFQPNASTESEETKVEMQEELNFLPSVKIKKFTSSEIKKEIQGKIKVKKAPGFDKITGMILKQFPRSAIDRLVLIFNAIIRLKVVPSQWKKAEIIVLLKPNKPASELSSYRPISLLPAIGKLFERLYIKRLLNIVDNKKLIIDSQFGFRNKHATIEQLHRVTASIERTLEKGEFCVAAFLDVAKAFDKVWHQRLVFKLSKLLPKNHVLILASYLEGREFRVRFEDSLSDFKPIKAGVPQGSVLSPLLYSLFTADIPSPGRGGKMGIFADDTLSFAVSKVYIEAHDSVQEHLSAVQKWAQNDRTELNSTKSEEVVFTLKKYVHSPLVLNGEIIPHKVFARYLGLTLDAKLNYKKHILLKKQQLEIKFRQMLWLLGRNSKLSLDNKILLYKSMLRPVWSYASQIWACAAKTNVQIIEVVQNKILRLMANAKWYERNADIRAELGIESITSHISKLYVRYEARLHNHPNPEAIMLLEEGDYVRRLKRRKPQELCIDGFLKT